MGATVNVLLLENTIEALAGIGCVLSAGAGTSGVMTTANSVTKKRKGVIVLAAGSQTIYLISIAGTAGGSAAISGVVNTLIIQNKITAQIGRRILPPGSAETTEVSSGDEVVVAAEEDASILDIAGGLAIGSSAGIGVTIIVLIFSSDIDAAIEDGDVTADGSVSVHAAASDDLTLLALAFGASGTVGVAGDVNIILFENTVSAGAGGSITAGGSISITADAACDFFNLGMGLAASGTVAATAVAVITYFYGETLSYIDPGAVLHAGGDVVVQATSREDITAIGAGAGGSGTAAISATVALIFVEIVTKAYTGDNVTIRSGGGVHVVADDSYYILGTVGSVSIGGVAGIGISALVALVYSTVEARIGANNTITAGYSIEVKALSDREFDAVAISCGVAGTAAISVGVAVLIEGGQPH